MIIHFQFVAAAACCQRRRELHGLLPAGGALLEKPFDDENLLASLNSALERTAQQTQRETELAEFRNRISGLSSREKDVLEGLVAGKANKIIAYELNMRESTVKVHVRNIMKKLHATNRTEVAYLASRLLTGEEAMR